MEDRRWDSGIGPFRYKRGRLNRAPGGRYCGRYLAKEIDDELRNKAKNIAEANSELERFASVASMT